MGTPQYISPEQAMGKKDLDAGTDIYSFGVMLYEMVVGQVPFSADTPFSIIHDHIYTPLPLPMKINPKVPETVQLVLLKALAKDRIDRYETVEDLMSAFKHAWAQAGVPMQGTAITMRPSSLKEDKTDPLKQDKTTAGKTVVSRVPAKKSSPWMWAGIGIVSIFCCLFAFVAVRNNNRAGPFARSTASSIVASVTDTPISSLPTLPESQNSTPEKLPITPSVLSPEVNAALEQVNKNPGDPVAHLKLSLAYWDIKERRLSAESLAQAANLAAPTDREFFLKAAEEYKIREAWVPSAGMYLRLVGAYGDKELPRDVEESFHEAIYKASEQKDMPLFVFFERIDSVDLPLGYIARGRYALLNGELRVAKTQLANAEKVKPDMYEVFLLKAEIEWKTGSQAEAKNILLSLSSDLGAPEWIRFMAENFLSSVK
jgi:hypothetical protein